MFWLNTLLAIVGTVSGLISLCVSIYRIKRKKLICRYKLHPRFNYDINKTTGSEDLNNKTVIPNERILEVEIINIGNVDITSASFESDLVVEILGGVIYGVRADQNFKMTFDKFKFNISPMLIKKGENIHFEALILDTDDSLEIEIHSRIIDLKPIKVIRGYSELYKESLLGFAKINKSALNKNENLQYLIQRSSFWIAVISVTFFIIGNMIGQHGWYSFWYSF